MMFKRYLVKFHFLSQQASLGQKVTQGGFWVFLTYGLDQIINLIRAMILARLLTPADFGLMGLVNLSVAALVTLSETGVWTAIIHRPDADKQFLNTAWFVTVLRGFMVGGIVFLIAPWLALFFDEPALTALLQVISLSFVLSGFNSLSVVLLRKNLDFRRLTFMYVTVTLVSFIVAVLVAFWLRNVWAFIWAQIAGTVTALILSYAIHDFRPGRQISRAAFTELFHFGKYLNGAGIITYLATQGDDALVGKVLGAEALGFYGLAYRASNLPATSISHVIGQVTFPAFATVQHDIDRLREMYLRVLRMVSLVVFPFTGGMFVLAAYLIPVLYGQQWIPIIPAFMVLCFFGLERAIGSMAGPVLLALGRTKLVMGIGLSKLVVMLILIYPLTIRFGFLGTSIAVTISAIAVQIVVLISLQRLLSASLSQLMQPMVKPVLGTVIMTLIIKGVILAFQLPYTLLSLLFLVTVGGIVYAAFTLATDKAIIYRLRQFLS